MFYDAKCQIKSPETFTSVLLSQHSANQPIRWKLLATPLLQPPLSQKLSDTQTQTHTHTHTHTCKHTYTNTNTLFHPMW